MSPSPKADSLGFGLEAIIVGNMLHDVFNTTLENVAQFIDRNYLDILITAKTIDL